MLRSKEHMINEYRDAVFEYFEKYLQNSINKIIENQDIELNKMKIVNIRILFYFSFIYI